MRILKKITLSVGLVTMLFACKEVPPFINYNPPVELSKDTCYVTEDIPEAQMKNVLVEDVSGVRCVNCPEAADIAHAIDLKHPGRVVVATLHPTSYANLTTPHGTDTFNTQEAENIYQNLIAGAQGLPTGAISRRKFTGESAIAINPAKWSAYADQVILETSPVNLELNANVDLNSRIVELDVTTTFTEADPTPVYLTIMVLESEIVQPQSKKSGVDDAYVHEDILRFTYTDYSGLRISDAPERGLKCEKSFDIEIPEEINLEHTTIAVVVNKIDTDNKEILQCNEVNLGE